MINFLKFKSYPNWLQSLILMVIGTVAAFSVNPTAQLFTWESAGNLGVGLVATLYNWFTTNVAQKSVQPFVYEETED